MTSETFERKLAAIFYADVVGYSRLMGEDEAGTHVRLKALRDAVFEPQLTAYHGRIIRLMGDGSLVEFPSMVEALACAVEIQRAVAAHNTEVAEDQRITFRIGINLGDIIVEDDDIYGDGVNIAARLEPLADPGGICISQFALDAVGNKLPLEYEDMGVQAVKNITKPVQTYRVNVPADAVMREAMRLDPYHPVWYWSNLGVGYFLAGQYEESIASFEKIVEPWGIILGRLVADYALLGNIGKAQAILAKYLELEPQASLELIAETAPYRQKDLERFLDGLRKAGMPEKPPLPLPDKP